MKTAYVCGPTVYDKIHVSNLKPIMTFDIFIRANEFLNKEVMLIHNLTDIDDKIIKKAQEMGITELELSEKNGAFYLKMLHAYNIKKPTHLPKVTDNLEGIIQFINKLVRKNYAYEIDGNVYFDIQSIKGYGSISNQKTDAMKFEVDGSKKHLADFALWKKTFFGVTFDSPWGKGRPGWHTECAFFVQKYLKGASLDLHGGGIDLIFPHHENENIQYLALNQKPIAQKFVHTGMFNLNGVKMSKSIGNVLLADEFLKTYNKNTLRYIILTSSITGPTDFNNELFQNTQNQLEKFKSIYFKAKKMVGKENSSKKSDTVIKTMQKFADWNFANGMKLLMAQIKDFNKSKDSESANGVILSLENLGFKFEKFKISESDQLLIDEWNQLRAKKLWDKADKLRAILIDKKLI